MKDKRLWPYKSFKEQQVIKKIKKSSKMSDFLNFGIYPAKNYYGPTIFTPSRRHHFLRFSPFEIAISYLIIFQKYFLVFIADSAHFWGSVANYCLRQKPRKMGERSDLSATKGRFIRRGVRENSATIPVPFKGEAWQTQCPRYWSGAPSRTSRGPSPIA